MNNVEVKVTDIIADVLGLEKEEIKLESDLREDLDGDSIDFADVIMELEEEFDIEVEEEAAGNIKTVADIVKYVEENK